MSEREKYISKTKDCQHEFQLTDYPPHIAWRSGDKVKLKVNVIWCLSMRSLLIWRRIYIWVCCHLHSCHSTFDLEHKPPFHHFYDLKQPHSIFRLSCNGMPSAIQPFLSSDSLVLDISPWNNFRIKCFLYDWICCVVNKEKTNDIDMNTEENALSSILGHKKWRCVFHTASSLTEKKKFSFDATPKWNVLVSALFLLKNFDVVSNRVANPLRFWSFRYSNRWFFFSLSKFCCIEIEWFYFLNLQLPHIQWHKKRILRQPKDQYHCDNSDKFISTVAIKSLYMGKKSIEIKVYTKNERTFVTANRFLLLCVSNLGSIAAVQSLNCHKIHSMHLHSPVKKGSRRLEYAIF